jgi:hypothetical protein
LYENNNKEKQDMIRKSFALLLSLALVIGLTAMPLAAKEAPGTKSLNKSTLKNHAVLFDVNRISSYFINNGLFASDPQTGDSGLEYPKGSGHYAIFTAGMWLLGLTEDTRELRAAAADYSTDFQGGIILPSGAPDDVTKDEYKVYKFNKGETVDAAAIAQGAPPEVIGDQMLYTVYNDANPANHMAVWQTQPIGLEVHQTVWGYAQAGPLGDACFIKFEFQNKGPQTLDSSYVAIFFDPDLGDATDDYVACDVDLSMGYVYNGTAYDSHYGEQVPAIGCDFFQGPMVDSPGDTAFLPSGPVPDKKILPMTAFVKYINSSDTYSDPTLESAEGGYEAYNYVRGFVWDGSAFTDPTTGQPSKFVNSGDPVTGTGWLGFYEAPPGDMRMAQASGPFTLPKGETMEVVVGLVAGQSNNYLNSVSIMKYNDRAAQFAYDNDFIVGSPPPAPVVEVFEGDQELVLNWDETARDHKDAAGYAFEGYNVYQAPSRSGDAAGQWTRIATFDKENFITKVYDEVFDVDANAIVVKPVQFGTDAGLKYSMYIDKDIVGGNVPLVNGKKYYFAVTGYTVNSDATPKALENSIEPIVATPHKPELKTQYGTEHATDLPVTIVPGDGVSAGDIVASATVVDPAAITGHDYRIDFVFAESGADSGYANAIAVKDVNTGQTLFPKWENISGGDNFPVFDGVTFSIIAPEPGAYGINTHAGTYAVYGAPYGGFSWTGTRTLTGVNAGGETFFAGGFLGEDFFGSNLGPNDYNDVKIHFVSDQGQWSKAYVYKRPEYDFVGVGTFPGWAEDLTDPNNPRRVNICFVENEGSNAVDMHWDPIAAETDEGLGGREYLFIMDSDYDDGAGLYDDTNGGPAADVVFAMWPHNRGSYTELGDWTMTVHMLKPVKQGDHVAFSTAGLTAETSDAIGQQRLNQIQVFPNPYFGVNTAETTNFDQFVSFINLPEDGCVIRIFTLSGQLIRTIEHDDQTSIATWNLHNDQNIPVGSGMYIAHIEIPGVGEKILKLAIVNREARYLHL